VSLRQVTRTSSTGMKIAPSITRGTTICFFDPSGHRDRGLRRRLPDLPDFPTITCTADQLTSWPADQLTKGILFYIGREMKGTFLCALTRGESPARRA